MTEGVFAESEHKSAIGSQIFDRMFWLILFFLFVSAVVVVWLLISDPNIDISVLLTDIFKDSLPPVEHWI